MTSKNRKEKDIRKKLNLNGYRLIEFVYDTFMRIKFFLFILLYLVIYSDSFSNTNKEKVLNYLESFDSLKTEFVQVNNNGDILSEIYIYQDLENLESNMIKCLYY